MRAMNLESQILDKLTDLPPFSPVLTRLLGTFGQANISCGALATLIEQDPVLAGSVLRLANSAHYSSRTAVTSIASAINLIGIDRLRNVVTALSVSQMWKKLPSAEGWSTADFNEHGLATAILAASLADEIRNDFAEGAFLAGLLHDVGKLLIVMAVPADYRQIVQLYEEEPGKRSWIQCEREVLDTDHAVLSALALEEWKVTEPIRQAVAWHHEGEARRLSQVIALADSVANAIGYSVLPPTTVLVEATQEEIATAILRPFCRVESGPLLENFRNEMDVIRGAPRILRS